MQKDTFFITTPIYYTNWIPHIGHAYSSIICDVIARYQKINWKKIKFSTGVDENSQKAVFKASELWMEIMPYLDMMAKKHKWVWDWLWINYTDFVRTTEDRHHKFVREVLQKSFDNGDIYEWVYEWLYCVWCEAFKKDEDLISHEWIMVCPDHLTEPQKIKEKNWFFRLSKYQSFIEEIYEKNPEFVIPDNRFNEVKAFLQRWLEDFSISRETNKFWIKLPFDETQVSYVWYDALFNYLTVCKYPDNWWNDMNFWPADLHVVGKEIIRFHAIFWPAMLKSAWYELPKQILTTWFLTVDWQKISKSLWNVIDPVEFSTKYSKDLLTLYMLSSINIGQDWDFSEKQAILMYNAKLANNLWNLVNRVVVLALKLKIPLSQPFPPEEKGVNIDCLIWIYDNFKNYNLKWVIDESFKFLDELNNYTTQKEPWQMIKDETKLEETCEVLYTIAEWLRQIWLVLYPFFPEKMWEMFEKLGLKNYTDRLENWELKKLIQEIPIFEIKEKWENLFNRFEI